MSTPTFIPPGHTACGTCSLCGGLVIVPSVWGGIIPPEQRCSVCGAVAASIAHAGLPVIPMKQSVPRWNPEWTTDTAPTVGILPGRTYVAEG